jgi:hypothetical protein
MTKAGDWALASSDASVRDVGPIFKQAAEFIRTDQTIRPCCCGLGCYYDQAVVTDPEGDAGAGERRCC